MYNVVKCDKDGMTGEMYLGTLRNAGDFHKTNSVTEVTTPLSQLVGGSMMFFAHGKLVSFTQDLPNLKNGYGMFGNCSGLKIFNGSLKSLEKGEYMFQTSNLTSFTIELPALVWAASMFARK